MTETRKDVGQGTCYAPHLAHMGKHEQLASCVQWQPLPQPGETMEKRAWVSGPIERELCNLMITEMRPQKIQRATELVLQLRGEIARLVEQETAQKCCKLKCSGCAQGLEYKDGKHEWRKPWERVHLEEGFECTAKPIRAEFGLKEE